MGKLIWHDLARYVTVTASIYAVWAAFWGIFYRKFFWDFVGGILRNPGGLQPNPSLSFFIDIIVKAPIVQILSLTLALFMIAIEYPLPFQALHKGAIGRSMILRSAFLLIQALLNVLYYQGTNAALYSLIACVFYARAQLLGEQMREDGKGKEKAGSV